LVARLFSIGKRVIGTCQPVYFIADIAANHDGKLDKAKKLIELAAISGASAVKFQHFRADFIVSRKGFEELNGKLSHQRNWSQSVYDVYKSASLPWDWTEPLAKVAGDCGVDFFTAPYDIESIEFVNPFVVAYKVGSGDITWLESIATMAKTGKPVFLATGASSMEDVERAVERLRTEKVPFCVMQCNTNYTGEEDNRNFTNVNVLKEYSRKFPDAILGLSDHTRDNYSVLAGVVLGASAIEKHFTDDNNQPGPDHNFSLNPVMWRKMVTEVEIIQGTLGDGEKKIESNEIETSIIQRRSLRFKNDLSRGHRLEEEDLIALRPCPPQGIPPYKINEVLGKTLRENVTKDQILELRLFS